MTELFNSLSFDASDDGYSFETVCRKDKQSPRCPNCNKLILHRECPLGSSTATGPHRNGGLKISPSQYTDTAEYLPERLEFPLKGHLRLNGHEEDAKTDHRRAKFKPGTTTFGELYES